MRTETKNGVRAGLVAVALVWAGHADAASASVSASAVTPSSAPSAPAAAKPLHAAHARGSESEAVPSAWSATAAAQLTRLEEQTILLKAQIRKLDAQAEVAQRTAALARLGSAATLDPLSSRVRVVAIEGLGHRYSAVLQTGDGQRFEVVSGDELPNGMKIVSIGANEVVGRWRSGRKIRMAPVLAARSGAVFNAGTSEGAAGAANGGTHIGLSASNGVNAPDAGLAPVLDRPSTQGLPPAYQPVQ